MWKLQKVFALITNSIYLDLKKVFVSISGKYLSKLKNISRDYFRLCAQQVGREQPFLRRFRDSELPPFLLISCSLSQYIFRLFFASSCSGLPPVNPSQDQRICLQWIKGQESKDFNLLYISFWRKKYFLHTKIEK